MHRAPKRLIGLHRQFCYTSPSPMEAFNHIRVPRGDLELSWTGYVRRIADADQEALAALYDATNHLVYGMALRIVGNPADAEEVTLDTYTQIWRSASSFDSQRGSVVAWLMTMGRAPAPSCTIATSWVWRSAACRSHCSPGMSMKSWQM